MRSSLRRGTADAQSADYDKMIIIINNIIIIIILEDEGNEDVDGGLHIQNDWLLEPMQSFQLYYADNKCAINM